jgi:hypothetical protein
LVILVGLSLAQGATGSVEAAHAAGARRIAIDTDPSSVPANTGSVVGSIETCAQVSENDALDADEDALDGLEIDVVIEEIPPPGAIATSFVFNFPNDPNVSVSAVDLPYADEHGWSVFDLSDFGAENDGTFSHSVIDTPIPGTIGSGALARLKLETSSGAVGGVFPLTLAGAAHIDTTGAAQVPDTIGNAFVAIDAPCPTIPDGDGDGVNDLDELSCGSDAFDPLSVPERLDGEFAGRDDDGDSEADEPLPHGSGSFDCDGDGFTGDEEDRLFAYVGQIDGDQRVCGLRDDGLSTGPSLGWPADLFNGGIPDSTDRVNILDLLSFLTPVRYLGTDVGTNPADVRWDLVSGSTIFDPDINLEDFVALLSGQTGNPPMFGGQRALNGPLCSASAPSI